MPVTTRRNPNDPDERAREDDLPAVDAAGEDPQGQLTFEEAPGALAPGSGRSTNFGGWSIHSGVVHDYIDPACPASDAAYAFFGWLLPPHLARSVS